MEVRRLLGGMQLYTDGVATQQESHPYEMNRKVHSAQHPTGCLYRALLQRDDTAN